MVSLDSERLAGNYDSQAMVALWRNVGDGGIPGWWTWAAVGVRRTGRIFETTVVVAREGFAYFARPVIMVFSNGVFGLERAFN